MISIKKLLLIFNKNHKPTERESLLYTAIMGSMIMFIAAILSICMLPIAENKHTETLNNLNQQLSKTENEYEFAIVNVMISMENENWIKQQEIDECMPIIFLTIGIGIITITLLFIFLDIIIDKIIP